MLSAVVSSGLSGLSLFSDHMQAEHQPQNIAHLFINERLGDLTGTHHL